MGGWARNPSDPSSYFYSPTDLDFNIGGRFVFWLAPHWGIGGSILYDMVPSNVYNQYSYDASGTYTEKDTTYFSALELVAFLKFFPFDRKIIPFYLLGGGGPRLDLPLTTIFLFLRIHPKLPITIGVTTDTQIP